MLEVPSRSEKPDLLACGRGEDDRALGPRTSYHRARDLDHRHGAGCIVVGAVVNGVALHGSADAEMIVVRVDENDRVAQHRMAAAKDADDIHCRP
jgi:hypothetical protein